MSNDYFLWARNRNEVGIRIMSGTYRQVVREWLRRRTLPVFHDFTIGVSGDGYEDTTLVTLDMAKGISR